MSACLKYPLSVPQWYWIPNEGGSIAGGLGLIEKDFHAQKVTFVPCMWNLNTGGGELPVGCWIACGGMPGR